MGNLNEKDLQTFQMKPRDEYGVKTLNTFYDTESGMMFCLLDAPDMAILPSMNDGFHAPLAPVLRGMRTMRTVFYIPLCFDRYAVFLVWFLNAGYRRSLFQVLLD
jgi:hypothetical protein